MPDRRSVLIIVNPTSGRGRGERTCLAVAALLRERGHEVGIRHTQARGDAEGIAERACRSEKERPGVIVACGGDGTVQEIVNAIVPLRGALGSDCPVLGLAPAGRCNDFARALQITTDPANIAEAISLRATADVDLGRVNERFFCTVATLGADAEVTDFVDGMKLPLTGTPAYVYGAIRVLLRYRSKPVRLHGDFGTIAKPVFVASSANTSSYGGGIPIAPGANPLDGMLDLCLIDAVSRLRSLWLLPTVFAGRHVGLPIVRFVRTAGFRLESQAPLDVWADGERIGSTPVHIAAAPGAVRVLVHQAFAVNARAGGRTLPA